MLNLRHSGLHPTARRSGRTWHQRPTSRTATWPRFLTQYRRPRKDSIPFPRLSEQAVRKMAIIAAGMIVNGLNRIQAPVF